MNHFPSCNFDWSIHEYLIFELINRKHVYFVCPKKKLIKILQKYKSFFLFFREFFFIPGPFKWSAL